MIQVGEPPDLRATPTRDGVARKFWNQAFHAFYEGSRQSARFPRDRIQDGRLASFEQLLS